MPDGKTEMPVGNQANLGCRSNALLLIAMSWWARKLGGCRLGFVENHISAQFFLHGVLGYMRLV